MIGPNCLNLIGAGNTTVPELGQLGLLYLMFVAGVELDLGLVGQHRRSVVLFGISAFRSRCCSAPRWGSRSVGRRRQQLLLGSLMASHTLLTYPAVRSAGLSTHRARRHRRGSDGDHRYGLLGRARLRCRLSGERWFRRVDRRAGRLRPRRAGDLLVADLAQDRFCRLPLSRYRPRRPLSDYGRIVSRCRDACLERWYRRNRRGLLRWSRPESLGADRGSL